MLDYLKSLLNRIEMPKESHQLIIDAYQKIDQKDIDNCLSDYKDENVDYDKMLANWQSINNKYKISKYLGDLLFLLLMCKKLEELYQKRGLSNQLFIDTMKDITYKAIECKLVKKEWGTFVSPWFINFYRLTRFSFGRLQIEIIPFDLEYKDEKYNLTPDMRCLGVHIPRDGKRMDEKEIDKSLKAALDFYRPLLGDGPVLFRCESWLLFNKTIELSSPDSNIYKFAKRFKIFKQRIDKDISEMWRLYDDEITDLNKLKADTSLRKKYLEYLKSGGKIGEGYGFFFM